MSLIILHKLVLVLFFFFFNGNKGWSLWLYCHGHVWHKRVRAETTLHFFVGYFFGGWFVSWLAVSPYNPNSNQSYFNMLAVVSNKQPFPTLSQNIWYEHFNILITLIHITKLDYCMQYKSFIFLLIHAYFLNPFNHVAKRLLAH